MRTSAFHMVWLDKGKEPNFYLVFRKKKTEINTFVSAGAVRPQLNQINRAK